ncbi:MAG: putative DNA binding domain-containing protein [Deltaproteobacteria bacterium]|nr:putative DNA binding domain-containing protein [Deltaproteobacteria bacterium]
MADLKALIKQGEGISIEFKECQRTINRNVYETVCAFLNRHGGSLLLGVNDSGEVTGVDHDCVEQIKKDFVTAINNPQKINPACYLSVDEVQIDGKTVLHIFVPESSQVHRCNERIFDRNEDGDLDITNHTRMVSDLYHRKQTTYSENKIYPFASLEDLRSDLIDKCRRLAGVGREGHPWLGMDDMELLKSAQLYQTDPETGKSGITLAGILLLGNDRLILSAVPHHRTDLILRKVNLDRYDDRDLVRTNLIESYERIIAFVQKHLPDPFYIEGMERISIRDAIFREVASNILIHREYTNAFPAKLIIERGQVRTENSNKPHGLGVLDPATFTPFPKNPVIGAFFREIHRADELGSGMRKLMKYGKAYGGDDPQMVEGDVFRIVVKVPEFGSVAPAATDLETAQVATDGASAVIRQVAGEVTGEVTGEVIQLLKVLSGTALSRKVLQERLGLKGEANFRQRYLAPALSDDLIEMTQPDSPKSPTQKYRLTDAGKHLLKSMQE